MCVYDKLFQHGVTCGNREGKNMSNSAINKNSESESESKFILMKSDGKNMCVMVMHVLLLLFKEIFFTDLSD